MRRAILIVDDNNMNCELLRHTLQGEYDVFTAENGRAALDILRIQYEKIAAVLMDVVMPVMDGYETLRHIREDTRLAKIPVIIITGTEDEEARTKAITLGASDFLLKPYNPDIIRHCLRNNIVLRDVSEITNTVQRDRLTGLYNREAFFVKAAELISAHEPGFYILSCLDINGFKVINDQYGTERGDEVLRQIARVLTDENEPLGGICGRISADNFVLLYPFDVTRTDRRELVQDRINDEILGPYSFTFSVGRYVVDDTSLSVSAMYDRAVIAKNSVKGRYDQQIGLYNASMRNQLLAVQEIVADMDFALKDRQFEVWFQPQYNLSTDELIGAEALVRWRHPSKGLIPPGTFVPIFEKNGFVYELDKYVWEETCRCLCRWTKEGRNPMPVSVNVSRCDLLFPDVLNVITGIVEKYAVPVELLRLEVTESAFSESTQYIVSNVKELIRLGYTVEIDDFGSGYSSLNTLKTVPAQIVKLDMKFLENEDGTGRGGNIIESVVRMTKWLGMAVIAEGVETKEQAAFLRSIGCEYVQGYFFAKPMPVADYEAHCVGASKKAHLLSLETVEHMDNDSFWSPESMDSIMFNSYVGSACVWEYQDGRFEILRVADKYVGLFGSEQLTASALLRMDFMKHLKDKNSIRVAIEEALRNGDYTGEFLFLDLPGCPHETWLRSTIRIIASVGNRYLVYCLNENITAQRLAEQRESLLSAQLKDIMENVECGISAITLDGDNMEFIFANNRYYELLGYTREQYNSEVGADACSLILPEDAQRVMDTSKRVYATGVSEKTEYRFRRRDGSEAWMHSSMNMTRFENVDKPVQLSILTDITEQRAAEHRERKAAKQLQIVLDNINGGISAVTLQADGSINMLFANDMYYEMFGYTRQEAERIHLDLWMIVHPEDLDRIKNNIQQLLAYHVPISYDYRCVKRDGSIIYVRCNASVTTIDGVDGSVLISDINDITAEKINIEQLRISEETNRLAIAHSRTVVCRFDIAARTLRVSPNVSPEFQMPQLVYNLPSSAIESGGISPETQKDYIDFYERIVRGEKMVNAVFQRRSTRGWRWIEAHSSTIFSDENRPVSSVISFVDITESMEKERAYELRQKSLQAKEQDSYVLYRCSVSRKEAGLEVISGTLEHGTLEIPNANAWDCTTLYARSFVHKDYRDRYLKLLDPDLLLANYYRGTHLDSLDFPERLSEDQYRWLRLSVELAGRPDTDDVEAYLMFEDIDAVKREELETKRKAETDPLTGLYNRRVFAELMQKAVSKQLPGNVSALFVVDLDGFKQVNDHFGHAVGDETLIEMAQKLRGAFRQQDLVCRLGEDEYAIFMGGVTNRNAIFDKARLVCAMLHKSFSAVVQLSASIGISLSPDDGTDFDELYRRADRALYHMKDGGKDGFSVYSKDMEGEAYSARKNTIGDSLPASDDLPAPRRKMLIVEDDEATRNSLANLFAGTYLIETATESTAALVRLRRYGAGISLVLLDLAIPENGCLKLLDQMQESIVMQSIPVIVVSGSEDGEKSLAAIRHGATDYITKPVDAALLKMRVTLALSRTENERLRAHNQYLILQNEETKRLAQAKQHSEELNAALHEAERADIAKSQFLSRMSHEIRTPLNAVIGYNSMASSALSGAHTEEERKQVGMKAMSYLTKSNAASKHLLTIINDILDMSAIQSGKMKVDCTPFDFKSLITTLTVMFFAQARAKGVNFEVKFDKPTDEWVCGDQLRINQILTNLLSNAIKFTPGNGGVKLTVTELEVDEASIVFRFVVSDTGIGMTKEYLGHIWTPFEQTEAFIARRFGGSGLGLSITKNLVDLMGGTISVESESGIGSEFTVELTLRRTAQPDRTMSYDFSNVNALVVDDDVCTCDYIKLLFERCGAKCAVYTAGDQAVEAFLAAKTGGQPFNLCLVDWKMPKMDGFATISAIRRIAVKELPIIVVTAYDFAEVAEEAEILGISQFVSKPLFQSSLFDLLANVSGRRAQTDEEKAATLDFRGARVLLVEDNSMNMEIAKQLLASAKLEVDSAWNGQEAIDVFMASKPGTYSAILMDVHMPEVDGYEATRIIRGSDRPDGDTVPIIAMTADAFAEDVALAHEAGMDDHIPKPIDLPTMYVTLEKYIAPNR